MNAQIEELYKRYYPRIFAYVYSKTLQVELAEDIAQQTFVNTILSLENFRLSEAGFGPWLYRIAHNLLMSHYRYISKYPEVSLDELDKVIAYEGEDAESTYFKKLEFLRLARCIEKLDSSQQLVMKLRYAYGLSIADTAFLLRRSISWVKVVQHRALIKLRSYMKSAA